MTKVDVQKNSTISMTRLAMVLSPYTSLCARCLGHSCKVAERRRQAVFRSAGRAICPGDGTCQREHTYFRSITAVTSVGRAVISPGRVAHHPAGALSCRMHTPRRRR